MRNPSHLGRLVRRAIVEGLGLSIGAAAKNLKISRQHLSSIMYGRSGISPEMAIRLEEEIGSTAEAWLQMQLNFDLAQARQKRKE